MIQEIMSSLIFYVLYSYVISEVSGIMIRKVCPPDESHKSCSFYEEYVCWVSEARHERVKSAPTRLVHCQSGCFCKRGYVRDYPGGGCIVAAGCINQKIRNMLEKLPINSAQYDVM